jgi:copper chaperone CopZ
MEVCTNSVAPRANSELFIELEKNTAAEVHLYVFEGITCSGCKATVSEKLAKIEWVLNVNMNTNFTEVIIASEKEVALQKLQETVSYDEKYKIIKAN